MKVAASGKRIMEWAAKSTHLGGAPRKIVIGAVGEWAKSVCSIFNTTTVHNASALHHLVLSRPPGVPLITVSNHMSTFDNLRIATITKWELGAMRGMIFPARHDFSGDAFSPILDIDHRWSYYVTGKCIPITRGGGIYQEHMNEAFERLSDGEWLHTFPEGKVCQEDAPIRRLKWGTASLIVRAPISPIVLPITHRGFEKVMPENFMFGKRPPIPLCNKRIKMVIGEPIEFDLPELKKSAVSESRGLSFSSLQWPSLSPSGLDEAAQRWLDSSISDRIPSVMENLRCYSKTL